MAHLYQELTPQTQYFDKKSFTKEKWLACIKVSRTLYVGNLSFYTTEEQIHELFSKCGEVKKVVMGLNRFKKSPCGFCFVEYFTHEQAAQAVNLLNKTNFDERMIRVDWDAGIVEGRQFGRGESGDQWRDDFRDDDDPARGGQGRNLLRRIEGQPDRQVYVGQRKHAHGKFGKEAEEGEPPAKMRRLDGSAASPWGAFGGHAVGPGGLPMSFGAVPSFNMAYAYDTSKGKGKGKGKGKSKGKRNRGEDDR
mmetsp:Transcript_12131/g.26938  ORF Transcript_12131/g.26938 Transcript_12131/m.26938 type:complete len:250 (-) Transcript_12131:57-806(-)